jgi:uncharacterized protein (UPF0305 family)
MKKGAQEGKNKKRKFVSTRKADEKKAQDLEKEIQHTNKLNAMLLKTINQIKQRNEDKDPDSGTQREEKKAVLNNTMMLPKKVDKNEFMNRSLMGN